MSGNTPNYYAILGISQNADKEEVKRRYKELIKESHPDRFKGLRAKYEASGDEELLKVIEEKLRQAEETSKFINEAFGVLSDPALRKAYDEETYEPEIPVSEIVVRPTNISFGTLNQGQRKSESFTVENKGGPAARVEIYWEDEPDWGELIAKLDPEETFPIKVTIKVDTTGIPSGRKQQKILVDVDGNTYTVDVLLSVVVAKTTAPSGVGVASPSPPMGTASRHREPPRRACGRRTDWRCTDLWPCCFGRSCI